MIRLHIRNFICLFGFLLLISGCISEDNRKLEEIKRITSPDKKVDAVISVLNGGATSSNGYHIFIVPNGTVPYDIKFSQFSCDHQDSLGIKWVDNKLLNIFYKEARIFRFSNFWNSDNVDNWTYVVEIKLNSESNASNLSKRDKFE